MYKIIGGILHKDKKPVFAIGQSYYPSFYHNKYPVPPEGDRMGEMVKDLRDMAEFGFNHVRYAARGDVRLKDDGTVEVDTPFIDTLCREAHNDGMSVSVRLHGYSLNLHGYENVLMINAEGAEHDTSRCGDFIQNTLHHEGIREDNARATEALARHFDSQPGVVGFQMYNEPHYPGRGIYDYHPDAIRAYRRWSVEKGLVTEEEAADLVPPRSRREQTPEAWARWRQFSTEALAVFLAECAEASKKGSDLPVYTCLTPCQSGAAAPLRGVDCFPNAKWADVVGYTCYLSARGADYYALCLMLDMNYSAAKITGKEVWCIEQDARTTIPPMIFNRNAYAALGAGVKGMIFYQWRGDAPIDSTPEPNGYGLINNDRTKTPNYDNAHAMVRLLHEASDLLVGAKPHDFGLGILYSSYALALADARENDDENYLEVRYNSVVAATNRLYEDLRKAGLGCNFTSAELLEKSGIKILFVPNREFLAPEEDEAIRAFMERGGKAYEWVIKKRPFFGKSLPGLVPYGGEVIAPYEQYMQMEDVVDLEGLTPRITSDHYAAPVQVLDGDGYTLASVINISQPERTISPTLTLHFPAESATILNSLKDPVTVPVVDGKIPLGGISDGCLVVIR